MCPLGVSRSAKLHAAGSRRGFPASLHRVGAAQTGEVWTDTITGPARKGRPAINV